MIHANAKTRVGVNFMLAVALALLLAAATHAATPGIKGSSFTLVASAGYISQPDGMALYSWGYGCVNATLPAGTQFVPFSTGAYCPTMQVPGPTLVVTEGSTVTVTLLNNLPAGENASIVFPGFNVTVSGGVAGVLTNEATTGTSVSYTFTATSPGTRAYYSGTHTDLQVEMGMYGAIVVIPAVAQTGPNCSALGADIGQGLGSGSLGPEMRLAVSAYDHPETCYDREYLFQFMELDPRIHQQAEAQVQAIASCIASATTVCPTALDVKTEPYHPAYFLINGRSMPDDMDPDYAPNYPSQPYNGNPHMHPGDLVLIRVLGQGHLEHPFHEHANHVRILGRDGELILSQNDAAPLTYGTNPPYPRLAGRMEFTTDTFPGQALDGIFQYTGKGLGWDFYGHTASYAAATQPCVPDANGYYSKATGAGVNTANYYEWCQDHNHPLETNPVGNIGAGGPATQFDPLIATNGLWYNGTPYLGPDAVIRNRGNTPLVPGAASQNPLPESGMAFMWHAHNEREITTNDIFPGGMLMMMLVDPPVFFIDETL